MPQTLLKTVALHAPEPQPPARSTEPAIHTHSGAIATGVVAGSTWPAAGYWPWRDPDPIDEGARRGTSPLHNRLFAAWQARDWTRLAAAARTQLGTRGPDATPPLHAFSAAAAEFFRPRGAAIAAHDIEQFLGSLAKEPLERYRATTGVQDRNALADHALALHCLGALGAAPFDPISGLRALTAFAIATDRLAAREARVTPATMHLVEQALHADVYLPSWSFRIDPCGDLAKPGDSSAKAPLELKLERLQRARLGPAGEGKCDCSPGEPECVPQNPCCATIRYYVADLLELRSWTHRYKAGDLAYIETVAAGEKRVRRHEMRRTKETFAEDMSTPARSRSATSRSATARASSAKSSARIRRVPPRAPASLPATTPASIPPA